MTTGTILTSFAVLSAFSILNPPTANTGDRHAIVLSGKETPEFTAGIGEVKNGLGSRWTSESISGQTATQQNYKMALERAAADSDNKELLLYVTDHCLPPANLNGGNLRRANPDAFRIQLGNSTLDAETNRRLLATYPTDRKLVFIADCCYSSAQLSALFSETKDGRLQPIPNRCGFASSLQDETTAPEGITTVFKEAAMSGARFDEFEKRAAAGTSPEFPHHPQATSDIFLANRGKGIATADMPCATPLINESTVLESQAPLLHAKARSLDLELGELLKSEALEKLGVSASTSEKELEEKLSTTNQKIDKAFSRREAAARAINAARIDYNNRDEKCRVLTTRIEAERHSLEALEQELKAKRTASKPERDALGAKIAEATKSHDILAKELASQPPIFRQWLSDNRPKLQSDLNTADRALAGLYRHSLDLRQLDRLIQERKGIRALSAEDQIGLIKLLECEQTEI